MKKGEPGNYSLLCWVPGIVIFSARLGLNTPETRLAAVTYSRALASGSSFN